MEGFKVNWLQQEVQKEFQAAEQDIHSLHAEMAFFRTPPESKAPINRSRRALPSATIAAGATGLSGSGVAIFSGDCGLAGIFETCKSEENAASISRLFDLSQQINDNVGHLKEGSNQKFLVVSRELQAI